MSTSPHAPLAVIILAAGQGTRMKSRVHKVLHPVAGRPMLLHLLASAGELAPARQVVVVGAGREQVERAVAGKGVDMAVQAQQLGTGHAVAQAKEALAGFEGDVLILYGDVPLVRAETMQAMVRRLHGADDPALRGARLPARRRGGLWSHHRGRGRAHRAHGRIQGCR
ncbi:bifunctional N-acetylglucosamine-1-phosphate-uridyltransferase/glucosamine-1-phosphate-acetyltransferase GlmU-like protein [Sphingobium sp. B1D3A]|uniref:Bifunctional N-acetylglucosamine-1-phosphate-uridyltransferase/glucosamine-1-phosphate-acetyltransferase GlmU-like protein n=1 Tax=Sphingobium lignivorans TaxID=2735886 RepID=A0ABR6NC98_9SPHN|nr:bifunctional N-acetylglucosamine-1-phosphate-uridyltransferase/glucosamine-1-phosphate-acetyltransferase GlmU-like protein [Sphingobium lignivorans]